MAQLHGKKKKKAEQARAAQKRAEEERAQAEKEGQLPPSNADEEPTADAAVEELTEGVNTPNADATNEQSAEEKSGEGPKNSAEEVQSAPLRPTSPPPPATAGPQVAVAPAAEPSKPDATSPTPVQSTEETTGSNSESKPRTESAKDKNKKLEEAVQQTQQTSSSSPPSQPTAEASTTQPEVAGPVSANADASRSKSRDKTHAEGGRAPRQPSPSPPSATEASNPLTNAINNTDLSAEAGGRSQDPEKLTAKQKEVGEGTSQQGHDASPPPSGPPPTTTPSATAPGATGLTSQISGAAANTQDPKKLAANAGTGQHPHHTSPPPLASQPIPNASTSHSGVMNTAQSNPGAGQQYRDSDAQADFNARGRTMPQHMYQHPHHHSQPSHYQSTSYRAPPPPPRSPSPEPEPQTTSTLSRFGKTLLGWGKSLASTEQSAPQPASPPAPRSDPWTRSAARANAAGGSVHTPSPQRQHYDDPYHTSPTNHSSPGLPLDTLRNQRSSDFNAHLSPPGGYQLDPRDLHGNRADGFAPTGQGSMMGGAGRGRGRGHVDDELAKRNSMNGGAAGARALPPTPSGAPPTPFTPTHPGFATQQLGSQLAGQSEPQRFQDASPPSLGGTGKSGEQTSTNTGQNALPTPFTATNSTFATQQAESRSEGQGDSQPVRDASPPPSPTPAAVAPAAKNAQADAGRNDSESEAKGNQVQAEPETVAPLSQSAQPEVTSSGGDEETRPVEPPAATQDPERDDAASAAEDYQTASPTPSMVRLVDVPAGEDAEGQGQDQAAASSGGVGDGRDDVDEGERTPKALAEALVGGPEGDVGSEGAGTPAAGQKDAVANEEEKRQERPVEGEGQGESSGKEGDEVNAPRDEGSSALVDVDPAQITATVVPTLEDTPAQTPTIIITDSNNSEVNNTTTVQPDTSSPAVQAPPTLSNETLHSSPEITGLAELIQIINLLDPSEPKKATEIDTALLKTIQKTQVKPAYIALQRLWKRVETCIAEERDSKQSASANAPLETPPPTPLVASKGKNKEKPAPPERLMADTEVQATVVLEGVETQTDPPTPKSKFADGEAQATPPKGKTSNRSTQVRPAPVKRTSSEAQTDPLPAPKPRPPVVKHQKSRGMQTTPPPPPPPAPTVIVERPQLASALPPMWIGDELRAIDSKIRALSDRFDGVSQAVSHTATRKGQEELGRSVGTLGDRVSRAVTQTTEETKSSGSATRTHIDKIDTSVSQLSSKFDMGVSTLHRDIKQLQDTLDKKTTSRPAVVNMQPSPPSEARPDPKVAELKAQVKELRRTLEATKIELSQAYFASQVALGDESSDDSTQGSEDSFDAPKIARKLKQNTRQLNSRCRKLFDLVAGHGGWADGNVVSMKGDWARCVNNLKDQDIVLRAAMKEKSEAVRDLRFFRFLVDQILRGFYSRNEWRFALDGDEYAHLLDQPDLNGLSNVERLAGEMYRLRHAVPMRFDSPTRSTHQRRRSTTTSSTGWNGLSQDRS